MGWVEITLLVVIGSMITGLWKLVRIGTTILKKGHSQISVSPVKPPYSEPKKPKIESPSNPSSPIRSDNPAIVEVRLDEGERQIQTATEIVKVSAGVTITVKRSRTIEHTLDVKWSGTVQGRLDIGLKEILGASIQGAIEKANGRTYQKSETIEYQVELQGAIHTQYKLTWIDIWLSGKAEMQDNVRIPFQFRERSELHVTPINST